jgi:hypothetical protein
MQRRRALLACGAALALPAHAKAQGQPARVAADDTLTRALQQAQASGGVLMLRHALAPGTFDPPGFRLGDCSTQRNLNDEGRQQARQLGAWLAARQLRPVRVRSSPWCRCLDTARLAFGEPVEPWAALGSPRAGSDAVNAQALVQLRQGLASVAARRAGLEAWVTHMFVFSALLGEGAGSGDAALLGMDEGGAPRVIVRLTGLDA